MKQCPQCSAIFPDDHQFCPNDGADLISQADPISQPNSVIPPQTLTQTPNEPKPSPVKSPTDGGTGHTGGGSRLPLPLVLGGLAGVVVVAGFALWPVFQRAEENRKREACQTNLRQIGLAFQQYLQDYDEQYPLNEWAQSLQPYLKNEAIYTCPARPEQRVGYAFNANLIAAPQSSLQSSDSTILAFESSRDEGSPSDIGESLLSPGPHAQGNHFLWADGRAAWQTETPQGDPAWAYYLGGEGGGEGEEYEGDETALARETDPTQWPPQMTGEVYPATRLQQLEASTVAQWSDDQIQYALNELIARRGFPFGPKWRPTFQKFDWYVPVTGRTMQEVTASFSEVERANYLLLAKTRNQRRPPTPSPVEVTTDEMGISQSKALGFTLTPPQGWRSSTKTYGSGRTRVRWDAPTSDVSIILDVSPSSSTTPLENWRDMDARFRRAYTDRYELLALEPVTINGVEGARWYFEVQKKGEPRLRKDDYGFEAKGRSYALLFTAPPAKFPGYRNLFEAALASFHLES